MLRTLAASLDVVVAGGGGSGAMAMRKVSREDVAREDPVAS